MKGRDEEWRAGGAGNMGKRKERPKDQQIKLQGVRMGEGTKVHTRQ